RRAQDNRAADEKYPALQREIDVRRDEALKLADERYPRRLTELQERFERDTKQLQENFRLQKETTRREHDEAWGVLARNWRDGLAQVQATVDEIHNEEARCYYDWSRVDLADWHYPDPTHVPPGLRFADFEISMSQIPNGVPQD